jgi:CheY-like chemotaxis protein
MARLLVVDDEAQIVMLMRFVLEKAGHVVEEAHNGAEALAALGVEPRDEGKPLPDLVLLDIMMPVMDGVEAAKRLQEDPRTAKLPILVVTAKGDMRRLFDSMPAVAGFFPKPFDPQTLRETVARVVAAKG